MKPEVILKALTAEVEPIASENPNGEFHVILSTTSLDRDGEQLEPGAFDPLPDHITFDIDHGLSVRSVVGSGMPFYADDARTRLEVKGTYASTALGQETRTLVTEGHIRTTSVAMKATKTKSTSGETRIPKAELYNGSFVAVPANAEALVLSSKAADVKAGARHSSADMGHIQSAHDSMVALGATCMAAKSAAEPDVKEAAEPETTPEVVEVPDTDVTPETSETEPVTDDAAPESTDENDVEAADAAPDTAKAVSRTADAAEAVEIARARIKARQNALAFIS
jgi:hypothetical protein